ncbi:MAG: TPM domain-containing protein [Candidatus Nanoarchaeia archaeon]|nr:TPM domain-containing protein [Candidatus Nanoarchaeia archaeon]
MKKIYLLIILILTTSVFALEKLTNYVNDEANIIDDNHKILITNELQSLKENTSVEMVIATVKSLNGKPIEQYSFDLADKTLGNKEKNNGILILVALEEKEYRIEVGYGLEGILNDAKVGRIGREILVPEFKTGNYSEGILKAVKEIKGIIENKNIEETTNETNKYQMTITILIILGMILLFIVSYYANKANRNNSFNESNDFTAARNASILFGGGRSGGFGGFGGGNFGGGGVSGGWK